MRKLRSYALGAAILAVALVLAACGSGGSDSGDDTGDSGGDPVSLAAFLSNMSQVETAEAIAKMLRVEAYDA